MFTRARQINTHLRCYIKNQPDLFILESDAEKSTVKLSCLCTPIYIYIYTDATCLEATADKLNNNIILWRATPCVNKKTQTGRNTPVRIGQPVVTGP